MLCCRYHSHPHITVLPSHVDVRTQAAYQQLDQGFVGVIISAFSGVREACKGPLDACLPPCQLESGHAPTPSALHARHAPA